MNIVTVSRILEITEKRTRFQKIKQMVSNWKAIVVVCILALTVKVAAEQLALIVLRHQ